MLSVIGKEVSRKANALCQKEKGAMPLSIEQKAPPKDALAKELQAIEQSDNFWV